LFTTAPPYGSVTFMLNFIHTSNIFPWSHANSPLATCAKSPGLNQRVASYPTTLAAAYAMWSAARARSPMPLAPIIAQSGFVKLAGEKLALQQQIVFL
jgi:hypothetical protein